MERLFEKHTVLTPAAFTIHRAAFHAEVAVVMM